MTCLVLWYELRERATVHNSDDDDVMSYGAGDDDDDHDYFYYYIPVGESSRTWGAWVAKC